MSVPGRRRTSVLFSGFYLSSVVFAADKQQSKIHIISGHASINNDDVYSHSENSNTDTTINDAPKRKGVTIGEKQRITGEKKQKASLDFHRCRN
jgi:hypothetical protein